MLLSECVGKWFALVLNNKITMWGQIYQVTQGANLGVIDYSTGQAKISKIQGIMDDVLKLFQTQHELMGYMQIFSTGGAYPTKVETLNHTDVVTAVLDDIMPVKTLPEPAPAPAPAVPLYVTVTGHRPDKLGGYKTPNPIYDQVIVNLAQAFEYYKPSFVITGMALGVDQWAAEICFNMGIPFIAAIPFENQEKKWPPSSQAKYHFLLSKAHSKVVVSQGPYHPEKMHIRNRWMVDHCHGVIAVWNGTPGGTQGCVAYAQSVGKPIYYVPLPAMGMEVSTQPLTAGQMHHASVSPAQKATDVELPSGPKRLIDL